MEFRKSERLALVTDRASTVNRNWEICHSPASLMTKGSQQSPVRSCAIATRVVTDFYVSFRIKIPTWIEKRNGKYHVLDLGDSFYAATPPTSTVEEKTKLIVGKDSMNEIMKHL